jgi:hypothetical protein
MSPVTALPAQETCKAPAARACTLTLPAAGGAAFAEALAAIGRQSGPRNAMDGPPHTDFESADFDTGVAVDHSSTEAAFDVESATIAAAPPHQVGSEGGTGAALPLMPAAGITPVAPHPQTSGGGEGKVALAPAASGATGAINQPAPLGPADRPQGAERAQAPMPPATDQHHPPPPAAAQANTPAPDPADRPFVPSPSPARAVADTAQTPPDGAAIRPTYRRRGHHRWQRPAWPKHAYSHHPHKPIRTPNQRRPQFDHLHLFRVRWRTLPLAQNPSHQIRPHWRRNRHLTTAKPCWPRR